LHENSQLEELLAVVFHEPGHRLQIIMSCFPRLLHDLATLSLDVCVIT
jgi:hypothetical protein